MEGAHITYKFRQDDRDILRILGIKQENLYPVEVEIEEFKALDMNADILQQIHSLPSLEAQLNRIEYIACEAEKISLRLTYAGFAKFLKVALDSSVMSEKIRERMEEDYCWYSHIATKQNGLIPFETIRCYKSNLRQEDLYETLRTP